MSRSIKKRVTEKLLGIDGLNEFYSPSEMKRLGKRVIVYDVEFAEAEKLLEGDKSDLVIFSGIHSANDWSRTYWWQKGLHAVNVTKRYCVVSISGIEYRRIAG